MNLAVNSRDAMPHGGSLTISTREVTVSEGSEELYDRTAPGKYVLITVSDTDTGIDKSSMERILSHFTRPRRWIREPASSCSGNGEEAVARFREHDDISLVLSDVVLPEKTAENFSLKYRR